MIELLSKLVAALRLELEHYGEMLARLDQQQETIAREGSDGVLRSISAVNVQNETVEQARQARELIQRDVARSLGCVETAPLAELVPLLPEPHRLLVSALVAENNQLIQRMRERAEQNHQQLKWSLDVLQRVFGRFFARDPVERISTPLAEPESPRRLPLPMAALF